MSTTTNPNSLLFQLRSVVPGRPLNTPDGLRIAELQANLLLASAGIDQAGTPNEIIEQLRFVEVGYRRNMPASGYTDWYKPRWLILLNGDEPFVRRRFSLMHEFKHVLDHPFIDHLYPSTFTTSADKRAELAADAFAAFVLMPKRIVKRLWGNGVQRPSDLAAAFGVSEVAMRYRLEQLGLVDRRVRCLHNARVDSTKHTYRRPAWAAADLTVIGLAA
jgi:Zn-dependent peptidase ImmA (M78 family)